MPEHGRACYNVVERVNEQMNELAGELGLEPWPPALQFSIFCPVPGQVAVFISLIAVHQMLGAMELSQLGPGPSDKGNGHKGARRRGKKTSE